MADEVETALVRKIGVFSLAGTFALVSLFSSIVLSVIIALVFPVVSRLYPGPLPFQLSTIYLVAYCIGSAFITFISFLILGLFYNLSSLITKGIKLYSS
ncbi:MAG: hypothetical protein M1165_01450 [Candidatus Pacearchaeota archaeon]|nr:hypothetical protein [Candidatus Pacearchaeota archaeon]MDE1848510.1 hypothetical protein [Nanoarchaeota archaeon]